MRCLVALHGAKEAASTAYVFFEAFCRDMVRGGERECPVCLEGFDAQTEGAVLGGCGHVFDQRCVKKILSRADGEARCPLCRRGFESDDVVLLRGRPCEDAPLHDPRVSTHGSKLAALLDLLLRIREGQADAKVLLFCQWADLEDRVALALAAHGLDRVARLSQAPNVFARTALLERFQAPAAGPGDPWVLLLSLEHSASGTHLTAANHVVLVHPMVAASAATARAHEQQALGRVCRLGQRRPVHVWRVFVEGTVEEELVRREPWRAP